MEAEHRYADLKPGAVISGKFRLTHAVPSGLGSQGMVWAATVEQQAASHPLPNHRMMPPVVAVKFYRLREFGDTEQYAHEYKASLLMGVQHDAIVPCYAFGTYKTVSEISGHPCCFFFTVLELIEPPSTIREFVFGSHLGPEEIVKLCIPVVDGLREVHSKGLVHRDLKPQNLLIKINPDGPPQAVVVDFGTVQTPKDSDAEPTRGRGGVGTPEYMSPEQVNGIREIPEESDIWSMGVVLFELLANELPFGRFDQWDSLRLRILTNPPPLHVLRAKGCPEGLIQIVAGCLNINVRMRWSAKELTAHLQRFHRNPAVYRPAPKPWRTRLSDLIERRPMVVAGTASSTIVALVLCVLLIPLLWIAYGRARKSAEEAMEKTGIAEAKTLFAGRLHHADRMIIAQQAFETGQRHRAVEILEECFPAPGEPDQRGPEWSYLWHLVHSELTAFQGHEGNVDCVAYSGDGKFLGSSGFDSTVRIWDSRTGQEKLTIQTNDQRPHFAWSNDSTKIAAGLNALGIWSVPSGKRLFHAQNLTSCSVNSLVFSPDDSLLAVGQRDETGGRHTIRLFDTVKAEFFDELFGHTGPLRCVAFSPDGKLLVSSADDHKIIVWSVKDRSIVKTLSGHTHYVSGVSFAPDGQRLASVSWDGTLRLWNTADWEPLGVYRQCPGILRAVTYVPDGSVVIVAGESGEIRFVDPLTGTRVGESVSNPEMVWSLSVSPDGRHLASSGSRPRHSDDISARGAGGLIKVWDIQRREEFEPEYRWVDRASQRIYSPHYVNSLITIPDSPNHEFLGGLSDGSITVWKSTADRYEVSKSVKLLAAPIRKMAHLPNQSAIATADASGQVRYWSLPGFTEIGEASNHGRTILDFAVSADGHVAVTAGEDHRLVLWDLASHHLKWEIHVGTTTVQCAALSPDGSRLATGDRSGNIHIRSVESGSVIQEYSLHESWVNTLRFASDGKWLISGGRDRTACALHVPTSKVLRLRGHTGEVVGLAVSPDATRVFTSSWDMTVKLWDLNTGLELFTFRGANHPLADVLLLPDTGQLFASVTEYRGVRNGLLLSWRPASPDEVWKNIQDRHQRRNRDHSLTIIRCAWALANEQSDAAKIRNRLDWLQHGLERSQELRIAHPADKQFADWGDAFRSRLQGLNQSSTR